MRRFDPAALSGAHVAPLKETTQRVADFAPGMSPEAFWFSSAPFFKSSWEKVCQGILPPCLQRGAIVALEDPVGMALDIADMIPSRENAWMHQSDPLCKGYTRRWAFESNAAVESVKGLIGELAAQAEQDKTVQNACANWLDVRKCHGPAPHKIWRFFKNDEDKEKWNADFRNNAWTQFSKDRLNDTARTQWKKSFIDQQKAYFESSILPLAEMHIAWMKSERTQAYLNGVFDPDDIHCGLLFTDTLSNCYESLQRIEACSKHMEEELLTVFNKKSALIQKALLLNHEKTLKKVEEALYGNPDPSELPWDSLIAGFGTVAQATGAQADGVLARFIAALGGPVYKLLERAADRVARPSLVRLGVAIQRPVVVIEVEGSKAQIKEYVRKKLAETCGDFSNKSHGQNSLNKEVAQAMRNKDFSVKNEERVKCRVAIVLEEDCLGSLPKNMSHQARAKAIAGSLKTVEEMESLNRVDWQNKLKHSSGGHGAPFAFGTVVGILQLVAWRKLADKADGAMLHEKTEALWRKQAGFGAFAGTLAENIGKALERSQSSFYRVVGERLSDLGKRAGLLSGLVMAGWDIKSSWEELNKGNGTLAFFTFVSGGAVGIGAICFFASAGPAGWICAVIAIGAALIIEYLKDKKLQEWLMRSAWGTSSKEKYFSMETEIEDLKLALRG